MKRRDFLRVLGSGVAATWVGPGFRRRPDHAFVERWSWAMGQPVHLMVYATSEDEGLDACAAGGSR